MNKSQNADESEGEEESEEEKPVKTWGSSVKRVKVSNLPSPEPDLRFTPMPVRLEVNTSRAPEDYSVLVRDFIFFQSCVYVYDKCIV
jgi:hypothetical protein